MSFESASIGVRAVLAGALFLAGCEAGQPAPTPDHRIVVESPSPQIPNVETPAGVCVELSGDFFSQDQKRENAETCKKAMGGAAVAIVVFEGTGKSKEEMDKVAADVETLVSEASGKLLKVNADVVPASPETEKLQEQILAGSSCIDTYKQLLPSALADRTMPELRNNYNFVIAVGPWSNCSRTTEGGQASPGGRHAAVWAKALEQIGGGGKASPHAFVAAHELFHLYGIGHEGDIWTEQQTYGAFGGVVDVRALLANSKYDEFGRRGSLMSNRYGTDYIADNPIHLDALQWPSQLLDGQPSAAFPITDAGTTINHRRYNGQFLTLELSEPILKNNKKFTSVALVPNAIGINGRDGFGSVDLCLVSEHNDIVWVSNYYENPKAKTMVFDLGGQEIEATLTPTKAAARIVS